MHPKPDYGESSSANYVYDEDKLPLPTCGIRATADYEGDRVYASATVLPCKHCSDEQRERSMAKTIQRRCYYCNQPGHQIAFCKEKENDEATLLIRQAIDTGTHTHEEDKLETQSSSSTALTVAFGRKFDSFKRIKNIFGVETNTRENHFYFIQGVGAVDVVSGNEKFRIQSVYYTPELDRNILSLDQLIIQGFTVKFNGERCKLFPTFSTPLMNKKNNITGLTREDEIGSREKQLIIEKESEHETFKSDYLNDYFEKLNLTSNEPDWNVMILQSMKFKEFQDCKALLDMLDDSEYVMKYKYEIEGKFEEMIDWFLKTKMGITSRPVPVYMGGHRTVTSNNLWAMVSKDMGHDYEDGDYMRILYAMYLDVIIYYYKFKSVQGSVTEDQTQGSARNDDKAAEGGRRTISTGCIPDDDREHYALFVGNDWMGMKKAQKRHRFDFQQAEKAVNEANRSVLMNSRGYNPV
ncbi:putative transcription factor interactor and regulator CCHC(Zn) family [Helianthus annuus]|nr:putative transcription factor interactor and regulator CCHC(Zn) family [Helianthus annuus]